MAKRFTFRLAKVLQHRKLVKDQKMKILSEKNQRLSEWETKKERILQELLSASLEVGEAPPALVELHGMYQARLREDVTQAEQEIVEARKSQEAALLEYQRAAREEEALIRLHDKQLAEYTEIVLHEEEKFLDELGTQKGNTQFRE